MSDVLVEVVVPADPAVVEVLVEGPQGPAGPEGAPYTGPQITVSTTPPSNPAVGDIWIDLN